MALSSLSVCFECTVFFFISRGIKALISAHTITYTCKISSVWYENIASRENFAVGQDKVNTTNVRFKNETFAQTDEADEF